MPSALHVSSPAQLKTAAWLRRAAFASKLAKKPVSSPIWLEIPLPLWHSSSPYASVIPPWREVLVRASFPVPLTEVTT